MTRYPFMEFAEAFLASRVGVWSDITVKGVGRRYRRMDRDIRLLRSENKISSSSPQHFTSDDVKVFVAYRKALGLSKSELSKDITYLKQLCEYCDNGAVSSCLRKNPGLRPVQRVVRLPALSEDDLRVFSERLVSVPGDHVHLRAYSMVGLFIFCGARTKELRLSKAEDLDMIEWEFTVNHPKGEGSYGLVRTVPVPFVIRPVLQKYMAVRSKDSDALFPSSVSDDGYLSANALRVIKKIVTEECGIQFDFRMCRRTFGQQYLDSDLDIESVSVLMGHASTKTTEGYYARRKNDAAIEKAKRTWDVNSGEKADRKNESGYDSIVPKTVVGSSVASRLVSASIFVCCSDFAFFVPSCVTVTDLSMAGGVF